MLVAQQVVLSQAATIQSLSFYVASPAGRLRLGIYNDAGGKPQTLKAQTAEFTPTLGWNTQNVVTPSQLAAGTYWLAYLPESNNLHFRLAFNGTARWFSYPYGAMPATFSSSPQSGSYHWSFYAALSAGMIQTNTPTPMATDTTTPSPNPTETSTQTQTPTITLTPTPTSTPTPIQTDIPSLSPTITPSPTPTSTSIPTETASGTSTPTGTATPTPMPTETSTQTQTPTVTVTPTPTSTPTPIPTDIPSLSPTITSSPTPTPNPIGNPNWPIKVSSNGRYLIDQDNVPFLIAGDSPHGLFGDLSLADAETYLAGAHANGINAIWVQLLCSPYSSICQGYTTYDGIAPFSWNGSDPNTFNLASPNENYFSRMDAMVNLAARYNINVFLDPIETGNWLQVLRSNGTSKDYNYGVYLGNRYKNFPNIVWLNGNDFQTWSDPNDDAFVKAVANGIKSVDTNHLQTVELDYYVSDSLNDPTWAPIIGLDAAYSYYPTYDQVLRAYHRNAMPVFMVEAYYEFQTYCCGGYSGPHELRTQEYWSLLSGAAGQLYGNANLYPFPSGWQNSGWQTSPGVTQFKIMNDFFNSFPWYNLVPDQNHAVITSGYGTYATSGFGNTSDYLTDARTPDGNLVISYLPTLRTITVDMTELAGSVSARWFDPSNGAYQAAVGSSFDNSGSRQFTPPGKNSSGDEDWILVLETNQTNPVPTPSITSTPTETGTPTSTSIPTETATGTPTPTGTATPTKTLTPTVTVTPTPTITYSLFPSNTPTPTATGTATPTKTRTQTITSTTTRTITRTPTVTSTATPTFTSTPTTPGSITIGETHILTNDDFGNGNLLVAQQVVLSQAATIQSLSFYVASPAGRLRLGIYDDAGGKPQTLRAQTAEFTPALGWNTQNVVTPTLLTAGTYWLAYLPESSDLHFRLAFNGTALYYSYSFGALPTTFSNSPQTGSYHWSFYATLLVWPPLQSELN